MRQTGSLRYYCQSGGQPWLAGMCPDTKWKVVAPTVASYPLVLRELPHGPVPYVAPSLYVLGAFPSLVLFSAKSFYGETQGSFLLLWSCSHIGMSSLSQVLPRSTTLASWPELAQSRCQVGCMGLGGGGGLNGPFEALRPQRFVPVSRLSCSDCVELQAGLCGQGSFPPL